MRDQEEAYLLDVLALVAARAIMESFGTYAEHDPFWPTIGFACRTQAQAQWQVIVHNALEIAAAKDFVERAGRS